MDDLISRQAAIDALRSRQTYLFDAEDPDKKIELGSATRAISELPAVQPERKIGRWIDMGDHVMCSCCGATHYGVDKNYCPNCGVDMRGGETT